MWAQINFYRLVELLLPTFLRRGNLLDFLKSVATPLQELYEDTLYKMQHNCSVIYLEKVLNNYYNCLGYNDQLHESTKIIFIDDVVKAPNKYLYLKSEIDAGTGSYLYLENPEVPRAYQYLKSQNDFEFDFIVHIPNTITIDEVKLRVLIDYYKLAGKKYLIERF
jgi:hypothetical protein